MQLLYFLDLVVEKIQVSDLRKVSLAADINYYVLVDLVELVPQRDFRGHAILDGGLSSFVIFIELVMVIHEL